MGQEQTNNIAYAADQVTKEQPNYIYELNEEQSITAELLDKLEYRLTVVSNSALTDSQQSQPDFPSHISWNVDKQKSINSRLRSVLGSLVV